MTECLHIRKAISELWDSVPAAHLAQLREKCLDIKNNRLGIEQPGGFRLWIDRNYSDQRIIGAEHLDSVIDAFCHNTDFINIGEYYLGTLLKVQYTMANRVEYKVQNLGSGGGWHRDNCYAHGFKCMLYLSDVTTNDGPFQFLPASHKLFFHLSTENAIGKYQFTNDEVEKLARLKKTGIEEVTANAGDLVLFDTNIIHRGKPVGEGHIRYALTNYYHYK